MNQSNKMLLGGMKIVILPEMKIQVKTHRNRYINLIFKKLYGYRTEYLLDEDKPIVVIGGTMYLRDKNTYETLKECCDEVV